MVVGLCVGHHAALPDLVATINPSSELSGAINNGFVPGRGLL